MKKTLNPMSHRLFHGLVGLVVFALSGCMQPLTPVVSDLLTTNPAEEGTLPAVQISVDYETDTDSDLGLCNSTTRWLWEASGSFDVTTPLFRWRLNNGSWQTTHATEYAQDNLPVGRHTFELQVRNARGQWFPLGSQSVDIAAARYRGNGHTHGMPPFDGSAYAPGDTVTLAEPPVDFARGNTVFQGWVISSVEDQPIQPGATISFPDDVCSIDLIAQWGLEGSGTPDDPYIVSSPEGLRLLSEREDMWADGTHIQLTEHIDLTEFTNWEPIGSTSDPFSGTFDGGGHTISRMTVDKPDNQYVGLFGVIGTGARIRNLTIDQSSVTGRGYVAVLAGGTADSDDDNFDNVTIENITIKNSTVTTGSSGRGALVISRMRRSSSTNNDFILRNVHVRNGDLTADRQSSGMVVGEAQNLAVTQISATGIARIAGLNGGGLIGWANASTVTEAWFDGDIVISSNSAEDGRIDIGGLIGHLRGGSTVSNSYAHGSISAGEGVSPTGTHGVGGLVGLLNDGNVFSSYTAVRLFDLDEIDGEGAVIGRNSSGSVSSTYWDFFASGDVLTDKHPGTVRFTPADLTTAGKPNEWDSEIWDLSEPKAYPVLLNNVQDPPPPPPFAGTAQQPLVIDSPQRLTALGSLLSDNESPWADAHIVLVRDIDLTNVVGATPFENAVIPFFSGTFDGQGYRIEGVNITTSSGDDELGLFGHTDNATIRDLHVHGTIDASSSDRVGLLVGLAIETTIERVSAFGSVTGNRTIGGLVGRTGGGQLVQTHADVDVTSDAPDDDYSGIGGLIGDARNGTTLRHTSATGTVTASGRNAGGLVGWYAGSEVTVEQSWASGNVTISGPQGGAGGLVGAGGTIRIIDSYATGDVTIPNQIGTSSRGRGAGGLVGQFGSHSSITNSWSGGTVTGQPDRLGGLVGARETDSTVNDSFWDKDNSGMSESAGGEGKTSDAMKDQNTFTGWDFTNTWELTNNQFPTLRENPPRSPQSGP